MQDDTVVRVHGLTYEYPGVRALDDVSFMLPARSVTALVGPNGAGKTTLLRCLAALDVPLTGEIEVGGIDVLEHPRECHRRIGYLSDFFGLYDALTVERALIHAASVQGIADAEVPAAVNRTARQLGIANKLGSLCSELSRGQRQRVAIAQALIHSPSLLILDEPASGLDPEARHELAVLFRQLRAGGMTLLVSSHILAELEEYSTHMLVMRAGRIVETRMLQIEAVAAGGRRIRVTLAQDVTAWLPGIRSSLQLLPSTELLSHAANHVICKIPDDDQAQSRLLQSLVQSHVPVIAFAEERENLQESYIRTLQARTATQEA